MFNSTGCLNHRVLFPRVVHEHIVWNHVICYLSLCVVECTIFCVSLVSGIIIQKKNLMPESKHHTLKTTKLPFSYTSDIIGPPMITVLKWKISFDNICGPSVFTFLTVCSCVCLSVRKLLQINTVLITQTCRSIFRYDLCTAWCH